ncbi:MAG: glutamate racemase, partial [Alphaproteobacteria bacterium]|nr:glutamate racemase [Alphaproteobacteria bacterium]
DTIVLGCTHYPFVRELIQEIVGDDVTLIDTGNAVAKQLQTILQTQSLITPLTEAPTITIWTNNTAVGKENVIQQLWGKNNANIKVMS